MPNKKIYCSVQECAHNQKEICDLEALNVAGSHAQDTDETYCASFDAANRPYNPKDSRPVDRCEAIECDVISCTYNEDHECSLDEIKVEYETGSNDCHTALNTCCDSFYPEG